MKYFIFYALIMSASVQVLNGSDNRITNHQQKYRLIYTNPIFMSNKNKPIIVQNEEKSEHIVSNKKNKNMELLKNVAIGTAITTVSLRVCFDSWSQMAEALTYCVRFFTS